MKRLTSSLALATLLLVAAVPAHATWSHDPVLGNNPVVVSPGQREPMVVVAGDDGSTLYAWEQRVGSGWKIYVQRIGVHGDALWGADGVEAASAAASNSNGDLPIPAIAPDGAGGLILAWESDASRFTANDINAARIDSAGALAWAVDICTETSWQGCPVIASDGAGGAIIGWSDYRPDAGPHLYAQRVSHDGVAAWQSGGLAVSDLAGSDSQSAAVADGAGGVWFCWRHFDDYGYNIFAQRLDGDGNKLVVLGTDAQPVSEYWTDVPSTNCSPMIAADGTGGAFLCWSADIVGYPGGLYGQHLGSDGMFLTNSYGGFALTVGNWAAWYALCSDLRGGAFMAWAEVRPGVQGYHLYGQRVSADGTFNWSAGGAPLNEGEGNEFDVTLAPDGVGGVFAVWSGSLTQGGYHHIFAQRVGLDGFRQWQAGGIQLSAALGSQMMPIALADGAGGFVAAWDFTTQRVDSYGMLGEPAPAGLSVRDVMNDQGGRVKLSWFHSYLDAAPALGISEYRLWRSIPAARAASLAARRGATRDAGEAFATGRVFLRPFGATEYAWEPAGSVPAAGLNAYSFLATTTSDSLPASNPCTAFMVEARAGSAVSTPHWFSAPDSGYSVDNLVPAAPSPLTGQFVAGSTSLHWQPNAEADLAGYRVYRGTEAGFVMEPSACVATLSDTGYVDACGNPAYFKLTAVDVHGNESAAASFSPPQVPGGGGETPVSAFAFSRPQPNPATTSTTLRFDLPVAGNVQLSVYDATGRKVRTLVSGSLGAGAQAITWDLSDAAGHGMPAGLYFAHLLTPAGVRIQRIVLTP